MRAGDTASKAAARQAIASANPKWQPGMSPLEEEERLKVIVPTNAQQVRQINVMIDTLMQDGDLDPDVRRALALWKTNYQMESVPDQVRRAFLEGFWCWLLGRGTDADTKRTLWGRANVAAHNAEVAAYLELFARKRTEYAARLVLMAEHVPDTLNGFYLYYKASACLFVFCLLTRQQYIVKGGLKKVQDPKDSSKWFYSLDDEQFLEDWDLFEQEGGKYAHMVAPAANRPAGKQPWGGDEENTPAMDPYPATAADRKLESCMDNLAQQIFNLNQSLSLSHTNPDLSDMVRAMSRSHQRNSQPNPTALAAAGNDLGTTSDTVGVDDEEEFDVDGGDGRDDEAEAAASLSSLSESLSAQTQSIDRLVEMLSTHGLRAEVREAEVERREAMKEATGEATTPAAAAAIEKAAAALQNISESFQMSPSTPMSPATGAVNSLTPVPPTKPFTVAELEQHKAAINAQYDRYAEMGRDKKELEKVRQRELAAVDAYIATLKEREMSFGSLSDLHSPETMAALATAQSPVHNPIIRNDLEQRISSAMSTMTPAEKQKLAAAVEQVDVILADSGSPVVPLEQSSSEGTPLGVVAARQRMRQIALAPTKGAKLTEKGAGGEVVEGKELGFGDSEGSSAALSEHSSDRDFIVSDAESSGAASSVQEQTATISDGSELADSLMDVSAIMQASSDASFEPAAKEVAKAAVAVQKAVTRASKKKEEEIKKRVHFDTK